MHVHFKEVTGEDGVKRLVVSDTGRKVRLPDGYSLIVMDPAGYGCQVGTAEDGRIQLLSTQPGLPADPILDDVE
ncbi:hypothetical protein [Aurantimonas sp. 22II-16-19i]|uniref:hypothetical protein n=1 Tax=Aurantimonas sp. 22II-16-19i TaxID=1317114 RepID=UPI0009F7EB90|nr:hypothetical protein [Aurantimonas sp. 22II-16-19i]ORE93850.1 hypothetical protein ATO4_15706 [Aurantimonas sp. 22II-16-19i]